MGAEIKPWERQLNPMIACLIGVVIGFAICYIAFFVTLTWWQGLLVGTALALLYIIADIIHCKRVGYF